MLKSNSQEELDRIIFRFLNGQAPEYQIIRNRIEQYICSQRKLERSASEDLVADVTLTLIESFRSNRFKGDSIRALNVFIFNTIRNKLSHLARHPYLSQDCSGSPEERAGGSRLHDEEIADQQLAARIYSKLDAPCRQLLWMRFHLQWTDQEISEYFHKSKNAISTAVSRCLRKARGFELLNDIQ